MNLTDQLCRALKESDRPLAAEHDAIATALAALFEEGRRAWPELEVNAEAFAAYIGERLPEVRPVSTAVQSLRGPELFLAHACAGGDARAMAALEKAFGSHLDQVIAGMSAPGMTADDFRQIVWRRLFVSDEQGPAKISAYAGHGSLAAWLRVTARRAGLNAIRGRKIEERAPVDDDLFAMPQSLGDPELDYLKATYSEAFRAAFVEAVEGLPPRTRTLLRQTTVGRLTVRQIGRMYGVHHATAARWISDARQQLVDATRAALVGRLEISQRELDSIMGLIASRLDVSVARVLGPGDK